MRSLKGGKSEDILARIVFPATWYNKRKVFSVSRLSMKTLRQRMMVTKDGLCWLNDEVSIVTILPVSITMTISYNVIIIDYQCVYTGLLATGAATVKVRLPSVVTIHNYTHHVDICMQHCLGILSLSNDQLLHRETVCWKCYRYCQKLV